MKNIPSYTEMLWSNLDDEKHIIDELKKVDWSFTDDNTGFLTHDIHPYPAKFIPQIPGHIISYLSLPGDLVMDPFGGSGTTALEAIRLGRRSQVVDANYVGILTGRVKTSQITSEVNCDIHAIRTNLLAHSEDLPAVNKILKDFDEYIPDIPNREKWFCDIACAELALIRSSIFHTETQTGRDIGMLAMSRIILKSSFQDSETRYTSKPRPIKRGEVLSSYIKALDNIFSEVKSTSTSTCYGVAEFIEADSRSLDCGKFPDASVDLIVTSPPYGNAMDYHLYHRFRLFWLGGDPRTLGKIEVGSHLRHQKESNGFETYRDEMGQCMEGFARVLRPGRYAAFVIGDSIYNKKVYSGDEMITEIGKQSGFRHIATIKRPVHSTKRSFTIAGRRAMTESIVILRLPSSQIKVDLQLAPYRLYPYEEKLYKSEISQIINKKVNKKKIDQLTLEVDSIVLPKLKKLTFAHEIIPQLGTSEKTWQAILENGFSKNNNARKDPKYVTHGLHPYKGKFYPQLAKSLINISGVEPSGIVFDPFCGSGTTLLESYLHGLTPYGCDMNPIAAKIAKAKIGILDLEPSLVAESVDIINSRINSAPKRLSDSMDCFATTTHEEIISWFPGPVIRKLNWTLKNIRSVSAGVLQDFLEVILSSIVRDVSQQDPGDLRIRRRKTPLEDADVIGLFQAALKSQYERLERFWSVRGYSPFVFQQSHVVEGDSRNWEDVNLGGIKSEMVDLIITSPPYATALPYIDTDRLSILLICGLDASSRRPIEQSLTGSREITTSARKELEESIMSKTFDGLPDEILKFLRKLSNRMDTGNAGFRRRNMPALLFRFFVDMHQVISNMNRSLKHGKDAFVVMGDNYTSDGKSKIPIPTTQFVSNIAEHVGMKVVDEISISVTTDNMIHAKNFIKENVVLRLRRK